MDVLLGFVTGAGVRFRTGRETATAGRRAVERATADNTRQKIPDDEIRRVWSRARVMQEIGQVPGANVFDQETWMRVYYSVGTDSGQLEDAFSSLESVLEQNQEKDEREVIRQMLPAQHARLSELCECIERGEDETRLVMDLSRALTEEPQTVALALGERYRTLLWLKSMADCSRSESEICEELGLSQSEYDALVPLAKRLSGVRLLQAMSITLDLVDNIVTAQGDKDSLLADAVVHLLHAFGEITDKPKRIRNLTKSIVRIPGLAAMVRALPVSVVAGLSEKQLELLRRAVSEENLSPEKLSELVDMPFLSNPATVRGYAGRAWDEGEVQGHG